MYSTLPTLMMHGQTQIKCALFVLFIFIYFYILIFIYFIYLHDPHYLILEPGPRELSARVPETKLIAF